MTFTDDITAPRGGTRTWIGRRVRDLIVLFGGLALALPLIVPFA
ncbi:hypothetical protein ABS772_18450 [Methylorubrum podarium]|jgi:hypothetical protein|uniref:Sugar ABC transporter permease n=1 Tax=Methylorubrum podarium TaxID=200476 RepID=A0ABV1QR60_9HYPH